MNKELEKPHSRKKDWVLTTAAFELLLTRLDSNREEAAVKYEQIRRALLAYFEHHGSLSPDEHVDVTFDQVARSLTDGKQICIENPAGYFYGVARNILRQYRRETANKFLPLDDLPPTSIKQNAASELFRLETERAYHEQRLECLEKCLANLSDENRELMLQYYEGRAGVRISQRRGLAERLGISLNLLRMRAMRFRGRLEACVEQCLAP